MRGVLHTEATVQIMIMMIYLTILRDFRTVLINFLFMYDEDHHHHPRWPSPKVSDYGHHLKWWVMVGDDITHPTCTRLWWCIEIDKNCSKIS